MVTQWEGKVMVIQAGRRAAGHLEAHHELRAEMAALGTAAVGTAAVGKMRSVEYLAADSSPPPPAA